MTPRRIGSMLGVWVTVRLDPSTPVGIPRDCTAVQRLSPISDEHQRVRKEIWVDAAEIITVVPRADEPDLCSITLRGTGPVWRTVHASPEELVEAIVAARQWVAHGPCVAPSTGAVPQDPRAYTSAAKTWWQQHSIDLGPELDWSTFCTIWMAAITSEGR